MCKRNHGKTQNTVIMENFNVYEGAEDEEIELTEFDPHAFGDMVKRIEARDITLSFSSISKFMQSPRHFMAYKLKTTEATQAMIFGDLVDCMLTSPDELEDRFCSLPDGASLASHDAIDIFYKFFGIESDRAFAKVDERRAIVRMKLAQLTKRVISSDQKALAERIVKSLRANDAANYILDAGTQTQKDIEFKAFGWDWRGKLDLYGHGVLISDIKKVVSAQFIKAYRTIEQMNYETQAAIYQKGIGEQLPFYFLCYDGTAHCSVIRLSQARIDAAWNKLGDVMERFERCIALNEWNTSYDFWAHRNGIYEM